MASPQRAQVPYVPESIRASARSIPAILPAPGGIESFEHVVVLDLERLLLGVLFERVLLAAEVVLDALDAARSSLRRAINWTRSSSCVGIAQILSTRRPVVNSMPAE